MMADEKVKPAASSASATRVAPQPPSWRRKVAACCIYALMKLVYATLRRRWHDRSGIIQSGARPIIFCTWHNRLALSMTIYHDYVRKFRPRQELAAMVSTSKDGGLLSVVLEKFGVRPVRGSTSRRGRQALLESTTWVEQGYHIAITPDGPRGPCYSIQEGIIALAQVTGAPIVPVSSHVRWKITLGTWDRFQIPLPFSGCDIRFGPALHVPREVADTDRPALRENLRQAMLAITTD